MVLSSWQSHCQSSPVHLMNADSAPRWPPTLRPSQPTWTVSPPERNGSCRPHPPSPFIITQPESWYSFYRPTEGGRLSRPSHRSKGVQPVPKAVYRSGCHDKQLPAVRLEPGSSDTAVRHVTTATLQKNRPLMNSQVKVRDVNELVELQCL